MFYVDYECVKEIAEIMITHYFFHINNYTKSIHYNFICHFSNLLESVKPTCRKFLATLIEIFREIFGWENIKNKYYLEIVYLHLHFFIKKFFLLRSWYCFSFSIKRAEQNSYAYSFYILAVDRYIIISFESSQYIFTMSQIPWSLLNFGNRKNYKIG